MYPDVVLWEALLFLVGGLWLVSWSADRFVDGAVSVAHRRNLSPFVVGMVIVGFGTSLPELCVSAFSAVSGHGDLSLGNAYGSNIYNIAVILGLMALLRPIRVRRPIRRYAVPVLAATGFVSWLLLLYLGGLPRWAAFGLLFAFAYLVRVLYADGTDRRELAIPKQDHAHPWVPVTAGLVALLVSSHFVVWGSVVLARKLGVPELVIGLTIVAAGTSLPELVTSLVAVKRRQPDLVLGNIIGSNLFNTLAVVGVSGLLRPLPEVASGILLRDLPLMTVLSLSLFTKRVTRGRAVIWLLVFVAYQTSLWLVRAHL